jgi:hypothetical protein
MLKRRRHCLHSMVIHSIGCWSHKRFLKASPWSPTTVSWKPARHLFCGLDKIRDLNLALTFHDIPVQIAGKYFRANQYINTPMFPQVV